MMANQPEATRAHFGATSHNRSPGNDRYRPGSVTAIGSLVTFNPANRRAIAAAYRSAASTSAL